MSNFDLNQQCPCGLGKKIKFCCKDIATDLEKILRAIDGKQFEAALRHIDKSLEAHPDRQSLWALKLNTLLQTEQMDAAFRANEDFLRIAPKNPIALSGSAVLKVISMDEAEGDDVEAVAAQRQKILSDAAATLHQALANCSENVPQQCFEALGIIGQFLVETGHVQAGREHLLFQYAIGGQLPSRGSQILMETGRSQDVPVLLKQETSLPSAVDWVHWKEDYLQIRELALRGGWTQAANQVRALIENEEAHPALLRAHAALRCRLPDPAVATAALHAVANHKDIPLEEAAETEALAQILDPDEVGERTDLLKVSYSVPDADALLERLLSDRRTQSMGIDFSSLASDDGGPPPKAGFTLLDRELPVSGNGLTIDGVPSILSEVLLFGKQTDRDARLETIVSRLRLDEVTSLIHEIGGETDIGMPTEDVLDQISTVNEQMVIRPQFPADTPPEFRQQYVNDQEKHLLLDRWPKLKNPHFDDKTPEEVAEDPQYKRRLLGTILMMQTVRRSPGSDEQFNLLRRHLHLPVPETIRPKPGDVRRLNLVRLPRVDPTSLNDDDLATAFVRSTQNGVGPAVLALGKEIVSRESMRNDIKPAEIYGRMSQFSVTTSESIALLKRAQEAALANNESPGIWLVSEFAVRMQRGEGHEAQALLNRIQTQHMNEPAVAQVLMQTLQQFGLIGPDGRPAGAPTTTTASATGAPPSPGAGTAPAASEGSVWTPDGPSTSSPSPSEEKKLWVPGMD